MTLADGAPIYEDLKESSGIQQDDLCGDGHGSLQMYMNRDTGAICWACVDCGKAVRGDCP